MFTLHFKHSPRTPSLPWTNGLVENQNRNLGTHLRLILQDPPNNLSTQTQMYAYAHNTTPNSNLKMSLYQNVFHTQPRLPLSFDLNLTRNYKQNCNLSYCSTLSSHSHCQSTDINTFFSTLFSEPISVWLLAVE